MGTKKRVTSWTIPVDAELDAELDAYLIDKRASDPFLKRADVVRNLVREGLKNAKASSK